MGELATTCSSVFISDLIRIDVLSRAETLAATAAFIQGARGGYVTFTGVHGLQESMARSVVREAHLGSLLTLPDGMPLVWMARRAGLTNVELNCGPEFVRPLVGLAAQRGWPIYIYGGGAGTARVLSARLLSLYPELIVAGTRTPPFRPLSEMELCIEARRILESGAKIVLVGISTPKQELWMHQQTERLPGVLLFGVGGAFDVHAGLRSDAPPWIRGSGFEWLFRTTQDPKRLAGRYARAFLALSKAVRMDTRVVERDI